MLGVVDVEIGEVVWRLVAARSGCWGNRRDGLNGA